MVPFLFIGLTVVFIHDISREMQNIVLSSSFSKKSNDTFQHVHTVDSSLNVDVSDFYIDQLWITEGGEHPGTEMREDMLLDDSSLPKHEKRQVNIWLDFILVFSLCVIC